jgi:hypothetical protein
MKTPEDPLDALLQEDASYTDDRGFTARVMASLPRRRSWLRPTILVSVALLGFVALAWWLPSWDEFFAPAANGGFIMQFSMESLMTLGALAVVGAALLWSVFAALKWED